VCAEPLHIRPAILAGVDHGTPPNSKDVTSPEDRPHSVRKIWTSPHAHGGRSPESSLGRLLSSRAPRMTARLQSLKNWGGPGRHAPAPTDETRQPGPTECSSLPSARLGSLWQPGETAASG